MSAVALARVGLRFYLFKFSYTGLSILLIAAFSIITGSSNDLFFLMSSPSFRFTGVIRYSSYLLHGIILPIISAGYIPIVGFLSHCCGFFGGFYRQRPDVRLNRGAVYAVGTWQTARAQVGMERRSR